VCKFRLHHAICIELFYPHSIMQLLHSDEKAHKIVHPSLINIQSLIPTNIKHHSFVKEITGAFMCLSLCNWQGMVRNGNQLKIVFSSNCDPKGLSHVQIFILHSIGKFPIKMVQIQCKWKLNIGKTKCYARTYSPSSSKWDIFMLML
jgi:hypothetical protein